MSSKVKDFNSYYLLEDAVVRDTFQQCFDNTRDLQSQVDSIQASGGGSSYVLPSATTQVLGGVVVGSGLSVTSTGVLSANATPLSIASSTVLGGIKVANSLGIDSSTGELKTIHGFEDYYVGNNGNSNISSSDLEQTLFIGTNSSTSTAFVSSGLNDANFTFKASRHENLVAPVGKSCVVEINGNGTFAPKFQLLSHDPSSNTGYGIQISGTTAPSGYSSFKVITTNNNVVEVVNNSGFDMASWETLCRQKFRPSDNSSTTATTKYLGDVAGYQQSTYTRYFSVGHIHTLKYNTLTSISDERMKQDISDSTLGLDFILTLQPKQFRYRPDINGESTDLKLSYGFVAQDIKALIDTGLNWNGWDEGTTPNPNPNWEADNEPEYLDTPQSLDYEMFIAPLVKAVQQQNQLIQELSARVADLESA